MESFARCYSNLIINESKNSYPVDLLSFNKTPSKEVKKFSTELSNYLIDIKMSDINVVVFVISNILNSIRSNEHNNFAFNVEEQYYFLEFEYTINLVTSNYRLVCKPVNGNKDLKIYVQLSPNNIDERIIIS